MKKFFYWFVIITLLLLTNISVAQITNEDYKEFANSFKNEVYYINYMVDNCAPTMCLIKVEIDSTKHVTRINLSDSAAPFLLTQFDHYKQKLNIAALEKYIKTDAADNEITTYLIPVFYSVYKMSSCLSQKIDIEVLKKYNLFDGKYPVGKVIMLTPISYNIKMSY